MAATERRAAPALAGLLLLAAFAATLVARAKATASRAGWPAEADLMYMPSSATLRRLSLGHTELAADLVAARANVYFGTRILARAPQRWLEDFLHAALDLDPRFHRLYLSGAAMVVYNGGVIRPETIMGANRLLTRGLQHFPSDWNLHFQLGFNKFYELPNLTGPEDPRVPGWRQEGLESLQRAALLDGIPPWLPSLVARLLTKQGADELAIKHLEQAYAVTSSPETREQIRGKLERLRGGQLAERMEESRRRFDEDLARAFPYAPEAFSVITGPRQPRVVNVPGLTDGGGAAP